MQWRIYLAILSIASLAITGSALGDEPAPRTGSFETTFTVRSPLSEMKSLITRLKVAEASIDYELRSEPFLVYVPPKYDPQKPMGLLVLINYKYTDHLPDALLPELADANMAFISATSFKNAPATWWHAGGLALDAVYNLERLYHIDRRRIYLFGGSEFAEQSGMQHFVSERLGLNFPEVFSGNFVMEFASCARIPGSKGHFALGAQIPTPPEQSLALAKLRPLVLVTRHPADYRNRIVAWFKDNGFKHVNYDPAITSPQLDYPKNTAGWLPGVLKFMDAVTANLELPAIDPSLVPAPATAPAISNVPPPATLPAAPAVTSHATPPATSPSSSPEASSTAGAKTGEFEAHFTVRGANSTPAELIKRFGMKREEAAVDYDLPAMSLLVYVPPDYNPASPPGLLVYLRLARFDAVPPGMKALADQYHLIYVTPKTDPFPTWQDAGLLLNIVENLRAQYAINKSRVYLMEGEDPHFLTFAMSDQYTGFISIGKFVYPGLVAVESGSSHGTLAPHDLHVPDPALMALSKTRPIVFSLDPALRPDVAEDQFRPATIAWLSKQGFQHVLAVKVSPGEVRYPNIGADFLKSAIEFLDKGQQPGGSVSPTTAPVATTLPASTPAPPTPAASTPATGPAVPTPVATAPTQPSPAAHATPAPAGPNEQAVRLLKVAKLYLDARRYDLARSKLNELIRRFPGDPTAATAQELLSKLPSQ